MNKTCTKCGITKAYSEFYIGRANCIDCQKIMMKSNYDKIKDDVKQKKKDDKNKIDNLIQENKMLNMKVDLLLKKVENIEKIMGFSCKEDCEKDDLVYDRLSCLNLK